MYEKAIQKLLFANLILSIGVLVVKTAEITLRIAKKHAENTDGTED